MSEIIPPLQELLQHITILILDDEESVRDALQELLQQAGYLRVETTSEPEEAIEKFAGTNILLTDHFFPMCEWDGLRITKEAKKRCGSNIEVIIYSGVVDEITEQAVKAGAIAFFKKPFEFRYLKPWIEEISKRIWLQKILDTVPDEIAVIDTQQNGKILYANKTKRDIFAKEYPLEGDYCWKRFEKRGKGDKMCRGCPSKQAVSERQRIRTQWNYLSRITNEHCCVDLTAAPLRDQGDEIRATVESCRDHTDKMKVEKMINEIESVRDWEKRLDIFLNGFIELGFKRARFYQRDIQNGKDIYRGIKSIGMDPDFKIPTYYVPENEPTKITQRRRQALLFIVDKENPTRRLEKSQTFHFLYKIGEHHVAHNDILQKKKWIDIPLIANRKVFAKVSIDGWEMSRRISNFDLEILSHYSNCAGIAIYNAQQWEKTKLKEDTERAIIDITREITSAEPKPKLIEQAVRRVCKVMNTAACSIFFLDKSGSIPSLLRATTHVIDVNGKHYSKVNFPESYELGSCLTGKIFAEGKSTFVNNLIQMAEDERSGKTHNAINLYAVDSYANILGEPLRNAMFAVLQSESGKIGGIRTVNKRRMDHFGNRDFDNDDLNAFSALAGQIAVAIENSNLMNELNILEKAKTNIVEDYSHTMKNLLQPLVTISQLLYEGKGEKEDLWRLFKNEIARMRTTVNTMLKLSQAEAGKTQPHLEKVDIPSMIDEVIQPYVFLAQDKLMIILKDLDKDLQKVNLDKQMIYDAIANMLDNAILYGKEGTKITVEAFIKNQYLHISVKDYGPEIPPSDRKRVFEKYYKGKDVIHKIVQLGIGLAFVRVACMAHCGSAYVDPTFKDGAKIVMRLPITKK